MRRIVALAIAPVVLAVVGVTLADRLRGESALPAQPIAFNHRLHMERAQGITCEDCHQFVRAQTYAGIPSKHLCFDCHDSDRSTADEGGSELAVLAGFAETATDIPWQRAFTVPDHVYFSHRRHVVVAGIECRECHAGVAERTAPPTRLPAQMSMDDCIDCHLRHDVSEDCVSCHR